MSIDKTDFIAFLTEYGSTILRSGSSFKGFFLPLQATKQLLDVKLEPGDAVVYTDPAEALVLGETLTFGGKSFLLVSNSKIQYINGNPIYLELGLTKFMPLLTLQSEYDIRTALALSVSSLYDILEGIFALSVPASYDIPTPVSASQLVSAAYDIWDHQYLLLVPAAYDIAVPVADSMLLSARYDILEGRYALVVPALYDIAVPAVGSLYLGSMYDILEQLFGLLVPASYDIAVPVPASLLLSARYDIAGGLYSFSVLAGYSIAEQLFALSVPAAYDIAVPVSASQLVNAGYDIMEQIFAFPLASSYNIAEELYALSVPAAYDIPVPVSAAMLISAAYNIAEELFALAVPAGYDLLAVPAISGLRAEFYAASLSIVLHWNAHDPGEVDHYEVHRSTSASFTPSSATLVGKSTSNSFRNRDLLEDATYYFKVCAVDRDGNKGVYSSEISGTTSGA